MRYAGSGKRPILWLPSEGRTQSIAPSENVWFTLAPPIPSTAYSPLYSGHRFESTLARCRVPTRLSDAGGESGEMQSTPRNTGIRVRDQPVVHRSPVSGNGPGQALATETPVQRSVSTAARRRSVTSPSARNRVDRFAAQSDFPGVRVDAGGQFWRLTKS